MEISITAKELMDKGKWDQVCNLKGLSIWCVAEGLMDSSESISLTYEEAKTLGLVKGGN